MAKKIFWTNERIKTIGKLSSTLFSALAIAGMLGGYFGKLADSWSKLGFAALTLVLLIMSVVFSDNPLMKEAKEE